MMVKPMKTLELHYPMIQCLIISDIPQFQLWNIRSRDALRPIARERKDLMDYNGGYLPRRGGSVNIHHYSPPLRWIIVKYSPAKTGEYPRIFPNFQNCARCEKDLKDNKDNSRHLGRKYARIFVLGHYLFLVPHRFPRASLSENCSLLGTDNVRGQISEHIFATNGDYRLSIHLHFGK